ncbi:MAG: hypothetical protein IT426_11320 [Pirellulales bacterium]|nr:hypothetical protein [Pirellulales bacterium]
MSSGPGTAERRQTVRCSIPEQRQEGELRFGEKRLKIQLLDESAGGFGVLCAELQGIEVGAVGLMQAGEDWFEVRVANIRPAETVPIEVDGMSCLAVSYKTAGEQNTDESASEPPSQPLPTVYRLGLCRLRDLVDPLENTRISLWTGLTCRLRHIRPSTWGLLATGMLLAILVATIPNQSLQLISSDTANAMLKNETPLVKFFKSHSKRSRNDRRIDGTEDYSLVRAFAADAAKRWDETPKANDADYSQEAVNSTETDAKTEELRRRIRRLDGAMPFTLPEVAQRLGLSAKQIEQIRELSASAAELTGDLDGFSGSEEERKRIHADIFNGTRKAALELLDESQKKKWRELAGEPEKQ